MVHDLFFWGALAAATGLASATLVLGARGAVETLWPDLLPSAADRRAESLLRELLGEERYRRMARQGYLEVKSPGYPGRVYLVPRRPGHVQVREGTQVVMRLCGVSTETVPPADVVVMHKLMIESDEEEYLRLCNRV